MNNCYILCDASASASASAPEAASTAFSSAGPFVPMLLILAIFYFMMIRPQQRKEKERRKMIEELRAGAKVIVAGGIIGTIVEATEKTFKIETAPGTEMEVLRSSVQSVIAAEGTESN
jgi:preprotein translocase subunit YajC